MRSATADALLIDESDKGSPDGAAPTHRTVPED